MTMEKNEEYMLLLNGKGRVRSFIHSENYRLDSTIVNDSKTTYLSKLIKRGITEVYHYVARNELLLPDPSSMFPSLRNSINSRRTTSRLSSIGTRYRS